MDVLNVDEVYEFLNFIMCLDVMVKVLNYVYFVNGNKVF